MVVTEDNFLAKILKQTNLSKDKLVVDYINRCKYEQKALVSRAKSLILAKNPIASISKLRMANSFFNAADVKEILDYAMKQKNTDMNDILGVLIKVFNKRYKDLDKCLVESLLAIPNLDQGVIAEIKYNQQQKDKIERAEKFLLEGKFKLAYNEFKWARSLTKENILKIIIGLSKTSFNDFFIISFNEKTPCPNTDYTKFGEDFLEGKMYSLAWMCFSLSNNKEGTEKVLNFIRAELKNE